MEPDVLVSLTAPKLGVKAFKGRHFLGGRFVPRWVIEMFFSRGVYLDFLNRTLEEKFELNLPEYLDCEQIVELESDELEQKL